MNFIEANSQVCAARLTYSWGRRQKAKPHVIELEIGFLKVWVELPKSGCGVRIFIVAPAPDAPGALSIVWSHVQS